MDMGNTGNLWGRAIAGKVLGTDCGLRSTDMGGLGKVSGHLSRYSFQALGTYALICM